eukprot:3340470-Rhodomonas_salina.1
MPRSMRNFERYLANTTRVAAPLQLQVTVRWRAERASRWERAGRRAGGAPTPSPPCLPPPPSVLHPPTKFSPRQPPLAKSSLRSGGELYARAEGRLLVRGTGPGCDQDAGPHATAQKSATETICNVVSHGVLHMGFHGTAS